MTMRDEIVDESVHSSKNRRGRIVLGGILVVMALLFAATGAAAWITYDTYHTAAQKGMNLAAQVRAACVDPKVDTTELGDLCERASKVVQEAPVAPTVKGDTGDTGPAGPPPTPAQVAAAVRDYCATGLCRGAVTTTQIQQAVRQYCLQHNRCKGPTGVTGATGQTGATGPSGTDGKDGKDGIDGQDAVPFSFTFVINSGIPGQEETYDCVVTDNSTPAICTKRESETPQ